MTDKISPAVVAELEARHESTRAWELGTASMYGDGPDQPSLVLIGPDAVLAMLLRQNLESLIAAAKEAEAMRPYVSHHSTCARQCEGGTECHASHVCDCGLSEALAAGGE